MKNSSMNITRCLINLSTLHQSCCTCAACICLKCAPSGKIKVVLPKIGVEILDCDKCTRFVVFALNGEREEIPDFLVYLSIPTEEPLFCFVEFKTQPDTHAIKQLKSGIEILQAQYKYFSVVPEPQNVDCVIARDRGKGMAHAAQLAVIRGTVFYYRGNPSTIRFVDWGKKLFPNISNSYYQ